MFGVYRYILAVLIVFSHIRPSMPFQFGAAAFVGLFLLSGYLTTYLIRNHYGHFGRTTAFFYLDRILRLYPQFLLFLALTLVADIALKLPESSFRGGATVARVFLNALIVPANYAAFLPNLRVYILIPAMWSLALLAQAYGLFPFLVLRPWVNRMAAALSLILFTLAVFGALPTPFFALRFLPSVLFIFILGKSWAEFQLTREREPLIITSALYLSVLILLVVVLNTQFIDVSYNLEVLAGLAAAGPLIAALSLRQRKKWDEFLGRAAYGVFLSHALIYNLFLTSQTFVDRPVILVTAVILLATATGFLGYFLVDKYVDRIRYRLRQLHSRSIYDTRPVAEE